MQQLWSQVGKQPPQVDDATQLVDGQFVAQAAKASQLLSKRAPANSSFLLTSRIELPALTAQDQSQVQSVAQLPLEYIAFEPNSAQLASQAVEDLSGKVLPVLRTSNLYLQIQGGAAWPGPAGRYTEQDIQQFARTRANAIAAFLTQQGVDPNRLLVSTIPPKFPRSVNPDELAQDRIVRFTLVNAGR
jgi:hypothetical protein